MVRIEARRFKARMMDSLGFRYWRRVCEAVSESVNHCLLTPEPDAPVVATVKMARVQKTPFVVSESDGLEPFNCFAFIHAARSSGHNFEAVVKSRLVRVSAARSADLFSVVLLAGNCGQMVRIKASSSMTPVVDIPGARVYPLVSDQSQPMKHYRLALIGNSGIASSVEAPSEDYAVANALRLIFSKPVDFLLHGPRSLVYGGKWPASKLLSVMRRAETFSLGFHYTGRVEASDNIHTSSVLSGSFK